MPNESALIAIDDKDKNIMSDKKFPAIFIGHGSPMNVINSNSFTRDLKLLGSKLPVPEAILVVSAHWLTHGTSVTGSPQPGQIYDFTGFPRELYDVKYTPPGSRKTAELAVWAIGENTVHIDEQRGIDHAAWAVLKHIFPDAKIPLLELSLDADRPPEYHFELGKKLNALSGQGILVVGSGNIVHNLHAVDFDDNAKPHKWAVEFDLFVKNALELRKFRDLIEYREQGYIADAAVPSNDHYLPMLYILGMIGREEKIEFFHESIQNASVSMRSFITV